MKYQYTDVTREQIARENVLKALRQKPKPRRKGLPISNHEESRQHFVEDQMHLATQYQEVHERAPRLAQGHGDEIARELVRNLKPHLRVRVLLTPHKAKQLKLQAKGELAAW